MFNTKFMTVENCGVYFLQTNDMKCVPFKCCTEITYFDKVFYTKQ